VSSLWNLALAVAFVAWLPCSRAQETPFVPDAMRDAMAEGNAAFAKKDLPTARRAYERVLNVVPNDVLGLVNLGVVEFSAGNTTRAEELLKKAVQTRIETSAAWLTLGLIYMDQERQDEALAALTQATLYDPTNARARNFLGVVIGRRGWVDGAQTELRRAVELDANYSDAHFNLAVFYLESRPPAIELARRHYFRAIELGAEKDASIEKRLNSVAVNP